MTSAGRILIMPKGEWEEETTYEMLDLVGYNGGAWLAKKTATGIEPSAENKEFWQNMCDVGDAVASLFQKGENYVKLPEGTMICYGEISQSGTASIAVTFPTAFADNKIFVAYANRYSASGKRQVVWGYDSVTTNGFLAYVRNADDGSTVSEKQEATYIAIGRWK